MDLDGMKQGILELYKTLHDRFIGATNYMQRYELGSTKRIIFGSQMDELKIVLKLFREQFPWAYEAYITSGDE